MAIPPKFVSMPIKRREDPRLITGTATYVDDLHLPRMTHIQDVELTAKRDGTITGLRARVLADMGAYYQFFTPGIPTLAGLLAPGCYKIPNFRFDLRGVFTNKTATDAYRGAGRPEATHLIERMVDLLAAELNMDPVAVRRKNFPAPSEFPFTTATGLSYDSGNYQASLDKAVERIDYDRFRDEQMSLRQQGKYLGVGFSTYVEICGIGPSSAVATGGWESATVCVEPTGEVTVLTGTSPHGQGQETSFAQIVADELGVDIDDVTVVHGDTAIVQYGIGTFGSRARAVGGAALMLSLAKVQDKSKKLAAQILEASPADMVFEDGKIYVRGNPDRAVTPSPVNPLGVKGVGEAGTIACSPAVVNAVVDALSPHAAEAGENLACTPGSSCIAEVA